jgi:hypothetical protein
MLRDLVSVGVALGSLGFFLVAILGATTEIRVGPLCPQMALATLASFLSVAQGPDGDSRSTRAVAGRNRLGGVIVALTLARVAAKPSLKCGRRPVPGRRGGCRLLGSLVAMVSPGAHARWLRAAALRVFKPGPDGNAAPRPATRHRLPARRGGRRALLPGWASAA